MNCKVIVSSGSGRGGAFSSQGKLQIEENGFCLNYKIEGDSCSLSYDGKTLMQKRSGNVCIEMSFVKGEQTECLIGEGGLSGSMPVFTNSLSVVSGKGGVKVKINYDCGGERVDLILTAVRT